MALQNFVAKVGPAVSAVWLNVVDNLKFTVFADAITKATARTALTSDAPLEVANGGTATRTPNASAWSNAPTWSGAAAAASFAATGAVSGATVTSSAGPNALAGDTVARGVAISKFKATTTSRNTNTVLTNDPDLLYVIPGAGTFQYDMLILCQNTTTTTQGFQWQMAYSGPLAWSRQTMVNAVNNSFNGNILATAFQAFTAANMSTAQVDYFWVTGSFSVTNTGTISMQWAQNSSSGNNTSVLFGSYLKVTQLS